MGADSLFLSTCSCSEPTSTALSWTIQWCEQFKLCNVRIPVVLWYCGIATFFLDFSKLRTTLLCWANYTDTLILVKQCKHFTEAHNLCSLSLHMEDYWDMKDMEDTLETPVHSIFLSSSQHGLLFSLSLSSIFYSFYSLSSFWSPSGSSLPTLPSPSTPLRTRTWGISINNQPLRNCPNVSTKVQNQMNDISHTDPKWDIPLVAHDNAWTWTCSPKQEDFPGLGPPILSSWVISLNIYLWTYLCWDITWEYFCSDNT